MAPDIDDIIGSKLNIKVPDLFLACVVLEEIVVRKRNIAHRCFTQSKMILQPYVKQILMDIGHEEISHIEVNISIARRLFPISELERVGLYKLNPRDFSYAIRHSLNNSHPLDLKTNKEYEGEIKDIILIEQALCNKYKEIIKNTEEKDFKYHMQFFYKQDSIHESFLWELIN